MQNLFELDEINKKKIPTPSVHAQEKQNSFSTIDLFLINSLFSFNSRAFKT